MSELPQGWTTTSVSTIASINMGQSPASSTYNEDGIGLPFFQGKAEFGKLYPTVRKWCTEPTKIAEAEDILLSIRAPVGPTNIAKDKCCIGRGLAAIRTIEPLEQRYLLHYFRHIEPWLSQQGTGSTFAAINGEFIRDLDFPLAPLNEQKRIADKLDSLLKRVDACRERLDRIPLILKRFRQAVLAAATSGALTEDWRETSSEWITFPLRDLVTDIRYGTSKKCSYNSKDGKPVLRIPNIGNGKLELGDIKYAQFDRKEIDALSLRDGDLLIVRSNGSLELVGKSAVVGHECHGYMYAGYLIRLRVKESFLDPRYLHYYLSSPNIRTSIELTARSTSGVNNINSEEIRSIKVRVPKLEEQHEIVRRVEKLFAFADKLEARYNAGRKQVEQLTPALLAKAFRGELVDQDPNDEPAAVLLERIRAERAGQETKQRRGTAMRPSRTAHKPEPVPLPLAAEPAPPYGDSIPQRILAAMKNGADFSRADLLAAAGISETEWLWAIRRLKAEGLVVQEGERRGARYRKA